MADDTDYQPEQLDFHPCDPPRGMSSYKLDDLTNYQKEKLNDYKLNVIRENHRYLKNHPEIRIVVDFLLKVILKVRPNIKLTQFLAKYLVDNFEELKEAVENSVLNLSVESLDEKEFVSSQFRESSTESMCKGIIQNILDQFDEPLPRTELFSGDYYEFLKFSFPQGSDFFSNVDRSKS